MSTPRPNLYEQRTTADGAPAQGLRPVNFGSGIGARLAEAGRAVENYAQADLEIERIRQAREEEDGRAYAAKTLAEFRAQTLTDTQDAFANAPDGWRGVTERVAGGISERRKAILDAAPTEAARKYLNQSLDLWTPEYMVGVAGDEQKARSAFNIDTVSQAADTEASNLVVRPKEYEATRARYVELVGGMEGLDANQRRDLIAKADEGFANAAVHGLLKANPYDLKKQLTAKDASGPIAALSAGQRAQWIERADNEIEARRVKYEAAIRQRVNDAVTYMELGLPVQNAPSTREVEAALGSDAAIRYEAARAASTQFGGLSTKSNAELLAIVASNTAPKNKRDAIVEAARKQSSGLILKQRQEDPMAYAIRSGVADDAGVLQALTQNDMQSVIPALAQRGAQASAAAAKMGTKPHPLTKAEALVLTDMLARVPAQQKVAFFDQAKRAMGDRSPAFLGLLDQIGQADDDKGRAKSLSFAGYAMSRAGAGVAVPATRGQSGTVSTMTGPRAANLVLTGHDLLNVPEGQKPTVSLPPEDDLRKEWAETVGGAYPPGSPGYEDGYQQFRYAYAALSRYEGDVAPAGTNAERVSRAVAAATGGVLEINGRKTLTPFLSEREFLAQAKQALGARTAGYDFEDLEFQARGPGTYAVYVGDRALVDEKGLVTFSLR